MTIADLALAALQEALDSPDVELASYGRRGSELLAKFWQAFETWRAARDANP